MSPCVNQSSPCMSITSLIHTSILPMKIGTPVDWPSILPCRSKRATALSRPS